MLVLRLFTDLKSLNISYFDELASREPLGIIPTFRSLKKLRLPLKLHASTTALQIATHSPHLTHLEMPVGMPFSDSFPSFSAGWFEGLTLWLATFRSIAPQLVSLELPNLLESDDPIIPLLKLCTHLKQLEIGYSDTRVLKDVFDSLPSGTIQVLIMKGFLDELLGLFLLDEARHRLNESSFSKIQTIQITSWLNKELESSLELFHQLKDLCREKKVELRIKHSPLYLHTYSDLTG